MSEFFELDCYMKKQDNGQISLYVIRLRLIFPSLYLPLRVVAREMFFRRDT